VLGTTGAHALHHQVEAVRLVGGDVVVVHGRPQRLARPWIARDEREQLVTAGQAQRGRRTAVDDAHDDGPLPAALEELLHRIAQRARLPQAAKHLVKFGVAAHGDRTTDGPAQRAADERGDGARQRVDDAVRARPFRHDHAAE